METPFEIYIKNIKEIKRFFDFVYKLEPASKLKDLIRKFGKVSRYWMKNHEKLKNNSADEWSEFNKRFNVFKGADIIEAEKYLSVGGHKAYDYTEVVGKQFLVMLVSILEVYLTQQFEQLIKNRPLVYLNSLEKDDDKELSSLSLELLNKLKFNPRRIVDFLINSGKLRTNFQNFESIKKHYQRLELKIKSNPSLEFILDLRHVIIHRYGSPDEKFLKKYGIAKDLGGISVGENLVKDAIEDIDIFINSIEKQLTVKNDGKPEKMHQAEKGSSTFPDKN